MFHERKLPESLMVFSNTRVRDDDVTLRARQQKVLTKGGMQAVCWQYSLHSQRGMLVCEVHCLSEDRVPCQSSLLMKTYITYFTQCEERSHMKYMRKWTRNTPQANQKLNATT